MKKIIIMSLLGTIFGLFSCNAQSEKSGSDNGLDNAINIDVLKDDFESKATATLPKDKTIAMYCRSGRRSKNAAKILTKNGYTVVELNSGYNGWKSKK